MPRVIMFVFAGRQPNMNLQLPFARRILAEHPNVEYHIWNLCRTEADAAYVRTIEGERITVRHDFYEEQPGWNQVYRHYTKPEYRGCLFVKLDDDVVFLETHRFGRFVDSIAANPLVIMAAHTVNNGACTALEPTLWEKFELLDIPLLDVHTSNTYGEMAHTHFFAHAEEMLGQKVELVPTTDWLSINAVGYDWHMNERISAKLEKPHPPVIAGRQFDRRWRLGDEGCMNTFPRVIVRGFVAGHLTFGPQNPTLSQLRRWRKNYAAVGARYLESAPPNDGADEQVVHVGPARWEGNWRDRFQASAP